MAGIVSAVTPIVSDAMEKRKDKVSGNELVIIPALYDKGFPLEDGAGYGTVEQLWSESHAQYADASRGPSKV